MTDNVAITAGAGTAIAADDISSVFYQRVKIGIGADGAAVDWSEAAPAPVRGQVDVLQATLTLDTAAYAIGDVLAATQEWTSFFPVSGKAVVIKSITILDKADQGAALDLVFLSDNKSIGTENAAVSVSDADAASILGIIPVLATDFKDLGGCRIATLFDVGLVVEPVGGTPTSLWLASISQGTGTYGVSDIVVIVGIA